MNPDDEELPARSAESDPDPQMPAAANGSIVSSPVESVEKAAGGGENTVAEETVSADEAAAAATTASTGVSQAAGPAADSQEVEVEPVVSYAAANEAVRRASRTHTRRDFVVAGIAALGGYGFWRWVEGSPANMMQPGPIRHMFETNARLSRGIFRDRALAPTYPLSRAENLRVNGVYGLKQELVPESWRLQVVGTADAKGDPRYAEDVTAWEYRYTNSASKEDQGHDTKVAPSADTATKMAPEPMVTREQARQMRASRMPRGSEEAGESRSTLSPNTPGLLLLMDDILKLPRHELVTQFKCIEGWSQIVHWAGVRMADFLDAYPPARIYGREPKYIYMETPNGDYYTGYDLNALRHPQALLVTEMMGQPLTQYHGSPLRLHMPTKYGYKQIKRIGLISYTDSRPDDYWTKLGYDWYAGL